MSFFGNATISNSNQIQFWKVWKVHTGNYLKKAELPFCIHLCSSFKSFAMSFS